MKTLERERTKWRIRNGEKAAEIDQRSNRKVMALDARRMAVNEWPMVVTEAGGTDGAMSWDAAGRWMNETGVEDPMDASWTRHNGEGSSRKD
jgi:hypothetical protein